MITLTPNTIIVLLIAFNAIFFYGMWMFIKRFFSNFYKAFDITILLGILFLAVSRVAGLIEVGAGNLISNYLVFIQLTDLRVDYLTMLLLPAIAFQIYVLNFDRMEDWRNYLGNFLLAGKIYVIGISLIELARAYMNKLPVNILIFHAAMIMVLLVIWLFVRLFILKRTRVALASLIEILITFIAVALVVLLGQVYSASETYLRIMVLFVLTLVSALTVLRLTRPTPVVINTSPIMPQNRI